jgi:diadenylate cyclase
MPQIYMPTVGISEVLDIIIVSALIYYILAWIRRTRAWALLKGIVIVVLAALMAFVFDLATVMWAVQNALAMGLIALVILFQPELRKALEQLGREVGLSFTQDPNEGMTHAALEELVTGVSQMAKKQTGALICIEKRATLDDIAGTGITLDAKITRQLILSIFENGNPLHDGAVIITNGRINAATCILPLTAEAVDHALGTRHRAALGLSEISDAIVVVVSEETGTISAASGGKLIRDLTEETLSSLLIGEILEERRKRIIPWKNRKL